MSDPKPHQEPSMEEILASIRRIISEDGESGQDAAADDAEAPAAGTMSADVFTLTQRADMDEDEDDLEVARSLGMEAAETPKPTFSMDFDDVPTPSAKDDDAPVAVAPMFDSGKKAASMSFDDDALMSPDTASAASRAFAKLQDMDEDESPAAAVMRASGGGNPTLDELVREALKPVLREWLDRNLPPMVETMVREEIQRLAATGRRR
ncbi:DUF2497 domain-containing protein [Elstera cyanobacteriorum]|uniref:Pole-organizing protein PopZ n=1 Tax=Elstera cyanobacteriorum TaxID=2022747 RepID=A0A255XNU1_9PROT|nr:DUF2497 domain-containing protein [Elstera cyanobacteriorum]MCK6443359.1 DUF2497 domain-containing protein [Elstera cyanobacteriorum]OYQ18629.1 hypothetical protein CHR90_10175 [Elstera cyanobacteriorum]GFZ78951.1 pole-organizing protein PopZ [Elstera cyanobacteriorum]